MSLNLCLCPTDLHYSLDLHTDAVCPDCLAPAVKDWGEKSLHNCIYTSSMLGILIFICTVYTRKTPLSGCIAVANSMFFLPLKMMRKWKWTEWNDHCKTAAVCADPRTDQMHSVNERRQQSRGNNPCHAARRRRISAGNGSFWETICAIVVLKSTK